MHIVYTSRVKEENSRIVHKNVHKNFEKIPYKMGKFHTVVTNVFIRNNHTVK